MDGYNMNDELFQRFWLAGMRKCNKKKAKSLFNRLLKGSKDPEGFTTKLVMDIQKRIDSNQFGFNALHPTTYLNGERWEDEIVESEQRPSLMNRLTNRDWAKHMVPELNAALIEGEK